MSQVSWASGSTELRRIVFAAAIILFGCPAEPAKQQAPASVAEPKRLASTRMWVAAASTVEYREPKITNRGIGRHVIGDPIDVSTSPVSGRFAARVVDGRIVGYVLQSALRGRPPNAKDILDEAARALANRNLRGTEELAYQAHAAGPDNHDAARLFSAFGIARGEDAAWKIRRGRPKVPWPTLAVGAAAASSTTAYVAASGLRVRTEPKPRARSIETLPITTPVHVLEIRQDWARVRIDTPPMALDPVHLGQFDGLKSTRGLESSAVTWPPREGWVAVAYLDRLAPNATKIAEKAHAESDPDLKTVLYERALAIDPSIDLARSLFDAAVAAHRWDTAMRAHAIEQMLAHSPQPVEIEVDRILGCSGVPLESTIIDVNALPGWTEPKYDEASNSVTSAELGRAMKNTCVHGVDTSPSCGPLQPLSMDFDLLDPSDQSEDAQQVRGEFDVQSKLYGKLERTHSRYTAEHGKWLRALQGAFVQPQLRITLINHAPVRTPDNRTLVIIGYELRVQGGCGDLNDVRVLNAKARRITAPSLPPRGQRELWVSVPRYDLTWAVILAESEGQADALVEFISTYGSEAGVLPSNHDDWPSGRVATDGPEIDWCAIAPCGC